HVLTVSDGGADDRAAREVARALAGLGALVVSRHIVDPSEAALEPALRGALEAGGLTVVLCEPGGSAGELVPRVMAPITGSWLGKEGDVAVSCVPTEGDVHVRLLARGATRALAEAALAPVEVEVRAALGADCYGQDDDLLEAVVGRLLLERGWTVSLAESCTGGLLGHRLTNIAGSSRY